jgi:DNA-binding NarL/FixJ family response regulator
VLLVVGHPSIGSALETLLQIEDRYEVRRVQSLSDNGAALEGWKPDVALVDGVLLASGRADAIDVPAIVLSGTQVDGSRLLARLPDGRGWLRKDATAVDLREAVDRAIGGRRGPAAPIRLAPFIVAAIVILALAAVLAAAVLRGQV